MSSDESCYVRFNDDRHMELIVGNLSPDEVAAGVELCRRLLQERGVGGVRPELLVAQPQSRVSE